jgi:hypothetical protein
MSRENQIAKAVMQIAAGQSNGLATFKRCYAEIPNYLTLTSTEKALSPTRPGEPMWHQLVRNIQSHHDADGNFIDRGLLIHVHRTGYQITDLGRKWLKSH